MNLRALSVVCLSVLLGACEAEVPVGTDPQNDPPPSAPGSGETATPPKTDEPGSATTTPATTETPVDMQDLLDAIVAKNAGQKGGGVLRVATKNGIIFEGASGDASPGTKMTKETLFEIASVSKTFTAVVIELLIEEGKLALGTALATLLPADVISKLLVVGGVDRTGEITVKQLLEHSSGLPDYWNDGPFVGDEDDEENAFMKAWNRSPTKLWEPKEILPYVRRLTPIHAPGGAHHYSDSNYILLGLIAEKIDAKPLHEIYKARITTPLAMTGTYLSYREQPPAGAIVSHRFEEDLDLHGRTHQSADWAGGGLVSSTKDLETFMLALVNQKLFKQPATLPAMQGFIPTGDEGVKYGLGIFDVELEDAPGNVWGHDGYGSAFMYYWPSKGIVLSGTMNQTETECFDLIDEVADRLAKK